MSADTAYGGRALGPSAWAKILFGTAVLAFGTVFLLRRRAELAAVLAGLSWPGVVAAVVLAVLGQLAAVRTYRIVMSDLGSPLPLVPAGRAYFVSQLGKYLPGSVWAVVALVAVARDYAVPRRTSLAAGVLTLVISLATAFVLAVATLPLSAGGAVRHFWDVGRVAPLTVAALHPAVVSGVLDRLLTLAGRPRLDRRMTYGGTLRAAGWQTLGWALFGLHAWALVLAVGGAATPRTLAASFGGFALSYALGPVAVVAPAGAGVREAALVLTLGAVAGGTAPALAVALLSRVTLVLVDFAQAGVWALLARRVHAPELRR